MVLRRQADAGRLENDNFLCLTTEGELMEVYMGDEKTTYVKMTAEKAKQIVASHIVNHQVVTEYTIGANE